MNETLMRVGRILTRLNFAREGQFRQDPALPVPPLPDLSAVERLSGAAVGTAEAQFVLNSLTRGRNRVVYGLREARRIVIAATGA